MANKPWCFDADTPISQLSQVADEWIATLEQVHSYVNDEEWADIIDSAVGDEISRLPEGVRERPDKIADTSNGIYGNSITYEVLATGVTASEDFFMTFYLGSQALKNAAREIENRFTLLKNHYISDITADGGVMTADGIENISSKGQLPTDFSTQFGGKYKNFLSKSIRNFSLTEIEELMTLFSLNPPPTSFKANAIDNESNNFIDFVRNTYKFPSQFINCSTDLESFLIDYYSEELSKLYIFQYVDILNRNIFKDFLTKLAAAAGTAIPIGSIGGLTAEEIEALKEKIRSKIRQEVEEAFADNLIYSEQCFMLTNIDKLITYKKSLPTPFSLPYRTGGEQSKPCGAPMGTFTDGLNQPLLIQGEPFAFMNQMAVEPSQRELFDIMPHELSSLTPSVKLFKVVTNVVDGKPTEYEIPIKFDINTKSPRINGIYRSQRGTGVGLKNFSFSYDGTDPFSAKKAISANLSIFASSFTNLLEYRDQNNNTTSQKPESDPFVYRYTDLALKTGKIANKDSDDEIEFDLQREQDNKLNFRLKVVVEWASSIDNMRSIKRENTKQALYNSAITLYLTPVIHTFDFDENGGVTFNISYQAYIEDFFSNSNFDIFAGLNEVRETRNYIFDYFKEQEGCDLLNDDTFKDFQKSDNNYIINKNKSVLNSIINSLHNRDKIQYINLTYEEIKDWMRNPFAFEGKKVPISDQSAINPEAIADEAIKALRDSGDPGQTDSGDLALSLVANSQENQNIAFFYLSDLISVVMNMIEEQLFLFEDGAALNSEYLSFVLNSLDSSTNKTKLENYILKKISKKLKKKSFDNLEQFRKLRVVLGPMEINARQKSLLCSIGDIPISLNYFIEFLSEKIVARDLTQYALPKFIKDVINGLVKEFINDESCAGSNTSQRLSINSTAVVGYNSNLFQDSITEVAEADQSANYFQKGVILMDQVPSGLFPLIKVSGDRGNPNNFKNIDKMTNFYLFSVGRSYPVDKYIGSRDFDEKNGIFHYLLGQDRGIVKNIKLQKTNTPGLKEVRFEQEGYAGLEQLREVYNVSIDTYLNPQTFPGTYIYIPPEGFAPDFTDRALTDDDGNRLDLTKFGIGGYYMITKTDHSISSGKGDTTIQASWVASKDGSYGKKVKNQKRGDGEGDEKVKKCKISSRNGSSR